MKPIQVVTIGKITPLFKGEEKAERIELINLEENGFDLVCGKDMYEVGQKAIFIQPDYNVSDISLFDSYIRPGGDESKSMLGNVGGKPRRIRAKKFNFHTGDNEPVYSNGILLRVGEVAEYLGVSKATVVMSSEDDLAESLGIVKYEEPENNSGGNVHSSGSAPFPSGIYKTDEDNIKNQWGRLENRIGYPVTLVGTTKVDGSSVSLIIKDGVGHICSRNLGKKLEIKKVVGRRRRNFIERLLFWTKPDLNIYELVPNDYDDFVKYGRPYLDAMFAVDLDNIVLRGELNGGSMKGSGNKNNPAAKEPVNIKFFGVDFIENGIAIPQNYFVLDSLCNFIRYNLKIEIETVPLLFEQRFYNQEEIEEKCKNIFKDNMIEGVVLRNLESTFSAKYMNDLYDSKK